MVNCDKDINLTKDELSKIKKLFSRTVFYALKKTSGGLKKDKFECAIKQTMPGKYYNTRDYYVVSIFYDGKKFYTFDFKTAMTFDTYDNLVEQTTLWFDMFFGNLLMEALYRHKILKSNCKIVKI